MALTTVIEYNAFKTVAANDLLSIAKQPGAAKHAAAVYVGTGGDVSLTGADGVTVVFKNVPSGSLLPVHAVKINGAGTTASDFIALYRLHTTTLTS